MTPRAVSALGALLAALAFAIALGGGAAPKLIPGWWDGHPRVEGRVFERKDLHIGLTAAYGCNRGEEIRCQPLSIKLARLSIGYITVAILVCLFITAGALARSLWVVGELRKWLAKAVLIQAAAAVVAGALILVLGPEIQAPQRFEVPIGLGTMALWGGVAFAAIAGFVARRVEPEPLRLKSTQPKNLPAQPLAEAASTRRRPSQAPDSDRMTSTGSPTQPRVAPAPPTTRPPPIPAARISSPPAIAPTQNTAGPPGTPGPSAPASGSGPQRVLAPSAVASAAKIGGEDAASPPSVASSTAPPPIPPGSAPAGDGAQPVVRNTIPPPLSAIPFWSGSPPPIPPPKGTSFGAPAASPPISSSAPDVIAPTPATASGASTAPTIIAPAAPVLPAIPNPPESPRSVASSYPTIIHAIPPPPGSTTDPAIATAPAEAPAPALDGKTVVFEPASATPNDAPPIDVPISTAPASLPPPKKAAAASNGPAPACPQCEAAMAWVDEHLRFYCAGCRMYF